MDQLTMKMVYALLNDMISRFEDPILTKNRTKEEMERIQIGINLLNLAKQRLEKLETDSLNAMAEDYNSRR